MYCSWRRRPSRLRMRDYLPGQAQATPMSYIGPKSKQQFVVITVPGVTSGIGGNDLVDGHSADGAKQATPVRSDGGYIIAYSL